MKRVRVYRLPATEWREWRQLRLHALHDSPQAFGTNFAEQAQRTPDEWRQLCRDGAEGDQRIYLLAETSAGLIVGMGLGRVMADDPQTVEVNSVWVNPLWRGRGVAGEIVTQIGEWAARHGRRQLLVGVATDNIAAQKAYAKQGFSEQRRLPWPGRPHQQIALLTRALKD